ncbi:MAG: hypothetical protein LLF95_06155, partial [Bacteroidales bacterium]|nr:hypothetical protein [Bacteroidales bacterium]
FTRQFRTTRKRPAASRDNSAPENRVNIGFISEKIIINQKNMDRKTFFVLSVSHLSNDNAYSLFKSTVDFAIPVRTELGDIRCKRLTQ